MATGIQTSVQRGRRTHLSNAKKEDNSPLSKVLSSFKSLDPKLRYGLLGLLLLALLGGSLKAHSVQSNTFAELYPLKLHSEDVSEMSMILMEHGIEHTVSPKVDALQVHPEQLARSRALLTARSLPRHQAAPNPAGSTTLPDTRDQRQLAEQRKLEGELARTLREIDGITEARVKIAYPPRAYFQDDAIPVTASVFLELTQGVSLPTETTQGIKSLISHSVPELKPDNVSLLDPEGKILEDGSKAITASEREMELQWKLQGALAKIYGPRVHSVVNVDFDYSKEERRQYTPGSVEDKGLVRTGSQLFREVLGSDKEYDLTKEAINYKYEENSFVLVRLEPKIDRITATVLIDGASSDELETVRGIVKGAIGMDETRADEVFLSGIPWNHEPYQNPMADATVAAVGQPDSAWSTLLEGACFGFGLCLVGLVAGGILKSRSKPNLPNQDEAAPAETLIGIVGHHQSKAGERVASDATATHSGRLEELERLVASRPEKVATLLRSTWLEN